MRLLRNVKFDSCIFPPLDRLPDIPGSWTEKELIRDLLHDYEKKARPVVDGVSPIVKLSETHTVQQITIEFGLSIIQILELDENEQVLTSSMRTLYVRSHFTGYRDEVTRCHSQVRMARWPKTQ